MKRLIAAATICAVVMGASLQARAEAPEVSVAADGAAQVRVPFGDLDTTKRAGAAVLLRRIRSASEFVCGPRPSTPLALGPMQAFERCVRRTMDKAVGQVRAPQVSALYLMGRG